MSKAKTKWIEDAAVTNAKLNADVAGTGLSGGAGSALSVDYGSSAGTACQGNDSRLPAGLTDERLLRADGATGIQGSGITVDDSNRMQEVKALASDSVYNNGNSTASFSWTLANGQHQEVTLNADSVALTIVPTGITGPSVFTLRVKQDATGGRAITSASISGGTVYYTGATEPTFPSAPSAQCEMVCKFDGTDCVCQVTGVLTAWT